VLFQKEVDISFFWRISRKKKPNQANKNLTDFFAEFVFFLATKKIANT